MNPADINDIRSNLIKAFSGVPVPPASEITNHRCEECDDVRDQFANYTNETIPPNLICGYYDVLSLLSPDAYHHFIVSYLCLSLDWFDEKKKASAKASKDAWEYHYGCLREYEDTFIFFTMMGLDIKWQEPGNNMALERIEKFTKSQIESVIAFLEFMICFGFNWQPEAEVALRCWRGYLEHINGKA